MHQFVTFSTNTPVQHRARGFPGDATRTAPSWRRSTRPSATSSCELMEGSRFRPLAVPRQLLPADGLLGHHRRGRRGLRHPADEGARGRVDPDLAVPLRIRRRRRVLRFCFAKKDETLRTRRRTAAARLDRAPLRFACQPRSLAGFRQPSSKTHRNAHKSKGCRLHASFFPCSPALIARIDRSAVHDGPGVRTVVFFKGCPLRCHWCHSPETQSPRPEVVLHGDRCLNCGACEAACGPRGGRLRAGCTAGVDRTRCQVCGECTVVCPTGAREVVGRSDDGRTLVSEIERDTRLSRPLRRRRHDVGRRAAATSRAFLEALLERCRARRIHTAVETCGYAPPRTLLAVAQWTDLFLYDLKLMNDTRHRAVTGRSNRRILENLRLLYGATPGRAGAHAAHRRRQRRPRQHPGGRGIPVRAARLRDRHPAVSRGRASRSTRGSTGRIHLASRAIPCRRDHRHGGGDAVPLRTRRPSRRCTMTPRVHQLRDAEPGNGAVAVARACAAPHRVLRERAGGIRPDDARARVPSPDGAQGDLHRRRTS